MVTMLHGVMWVCLCIPGHIQCSCSTVMPLLCIPLSELVSFAFSTIPICPFLIQRIFHLLVIVYKCHCYYTCIFSLDNPYSIQPCSHKESGLKVTIEHRSTSIANTSVSLTSLSTQEALNFVFERVSPDHTLAEVRSSRRSLRQQPA